MRGDCGIGIVDHRLAIFGRNARRLIQQVYDGYPIGRADNLDSAKASTNSATIKLRSRQNKDPPSAPSRAGCAGRSTRPAESWPTTLARPDCRKRFRRTSVTSVCEQARTGLPDPPLSGCRAMSIANSGSTTIHPRQLYPPHPRQTIAAAAVSFCVQRSYSSRQSSALRNCFHAAGLENHIPARPRLGESRTASPRRVGQAR